MGLLDKCFVDGNKRAALTAMGLFLELDDYHQVASHGAALTFTQRAATGEAEPAEMARWLEAHCQPIVA